jgi:hypothetical protein
MFDFFKALSVFNLVFLSEVEHKKFKERTDIYFNEKSAKMNMSAGHLGQTLAMCGLVLIIIMALNTFVLIIYVALPWKFE